MDVLDAFTEECQAIDATLAGVRDADWHRPALGEWDLSQLVAHLIRGVNRIAVYAGQPVNGPVETDRISYWRYDAAAEAAGVARRAAEEAAGIPAASLPERFAAGWRRSVERAAALPADFVLPTFRGPMRLDEYAATRVLEAVVHHIDVRSALDLPANSTVAAARITMDILEGLLGQPRPRNLGRGRFIAVATGRLSSDDPRFPLLR